MKQHPIIKGYIELTKPRILNMVLITASLGYFLAQGGFDPIERFMIFLAGTALVCAGASTLNHFLERDIDKLMDRTKNRPLPAGLISPPNALIFGILLVLSGVFLLVLKVNLLTAFLSLLSAFLYVLVYTPMKRISWFNTTVGSIPGALPPLGGWAAANGELSPAAWALFGIMFVWQHPHFYSIAWIFKDDYRKGGLKMLPVVHPDGKSMFAQIVMFSLLLIPVSLLPSYYGISGRIYFFGTLALGLLFLAQSILLANSKSLADARNLLKASVVYLPTLLFLILIDSTF